MNREEYQRLALRTAKTFDTRNETLLYFTAGIGSEVGEVADAILSGEPSERIESELGDAMYYCAVSAHNVGIRLGELGMGKYPVTDDLKSAGLALSARAGTVYEIIKKMVRDGRPLDKPKLQVAFSTFYDQAEATALLCGTTIENVFANNIRKLEARYPSRKFDVADAIARKDGEELKE